MTTDTQLQISRPRKKVYGGYEAIRRKCRIRPAKPAPVRGWFLLYGGLSAPQQQRTSFFKSLGNIKAADRRCLTE